jgi:hypothetical protein
MKSLEFSRKIHDDDVKLKKGLKCHGWVMGHGWGLHRRTWKMGGWGRNIAPKTLHVLMGYVSRAPVAPTLKSTCFDGW